MGDIVAAMAKAATTAAIAAAMAGAAYCLTQAVSKRRKLTDEEEKASPTFSLVDELLETDALLDVVRLMPAATTTQLSRTSRVIHARVSDPQVVSWCAESRKQLLRKRAVPGDLPLAFTPDCKWTLERLHLCEHPPRFPQVLFRFACDEVEDGTGPSSEIAKVAAILRRHPKLRLRIHGYAQPDAPSSIGEALAQARATSVRKALLLKLMDVPEFVDDDAEEGVRPNYEQSPWSAGLALRTTRLVGNKVQALGRWGHSPRNLNFVDEANDANDDSLSETDDDDEMEFGGPNRLRRAEFTVLGLD